MPDRHVDRGIYASDILTTNFTKRVDDNLYDQSVLGWSAPIGGELPVPRGMRVRHATGVDASGRTHSVVIPDTACDIWQRVSNVWTIIDGAGATQNVTVTGLVGEALTL
jgi:hypothetical protein